MILTTDILVLLVITDQKARAKEFLVVKTPTIQTCLKVAQKIVSNAKKITSVSLLGNLLANNALQALHLILTQPLANVWV